MTDQEMTEKFNDSVENFELYQKALGAGFPWMHFIKFFGGEEAQKIMEVVGNAACVNLFWDRRNSESVFKLSKRVREQYFRNSCKAAYVAGAIFSEQIASLARR